jgi:hypothetical protein
MMTRASRWTTWLIVLGLGAACFAGGRISASSPEGAAPKCKTPVAIDLGQALRRAQPVDKPQPRVPRRAITTPPLHLTTAPDESAAEQLRAYEAKQGADLVGLLRAHVRRVSFMAANPQDHTNIVNHLSGYLDGWADGLVRTSPTLLDDLAHEVETALCDPQTPAVEVMLYQRLGRIMPELTSATGFECVLNTGIEEGPVLWETLQTLKVSGLPDPKSLAAIEARATDETTQRILHPEPRPAPSDEDQPSGETELSAAEQRAVLDGLIAERSQGLAPLPVSP